MEIIDFERPAVDGDCFNDLGLFRQLQWRPALGQRNGAACHEWDLHRHRRVVHLLGPVPAVGQVLVVENRHDAAAVLKNGDDLVEEPLARVFALPLCINRVVPVLANGEHGIDSQLLASQTERLRDGRVDGNLVGFGDVAGHVSGWKLIPVEADNIHVWRSSLAVE